MIAFTVLVGILYCQNQYASALGVGKAKAVLTTALEDRIPLEVNSFQSELESKEKEVVVSITYDPMAKRQEMMGFGAAFTQAAGLNYLKLRPNDQLKFLSLMFGEKGNRLSLGRIPMNSCDFSPTSYSFDDIADDFALDSFDMKLRMDQEYGMLELLQKASQFRNLTLFGSPWSPPSWMKADNHDMVGSGLPCLKSDPQYQQAWADYFGKWIDAYEGLGIPIWGLTAQNEPGFWTNEGWEACSYTAAQQRDFIANYLGPSLEKRYGKDGKKLMYFDWNKDVLVEWADTVLGDATAASYLWGTGLHWYSGDFFNQVSKVYEKYPDKKMLATEGCSCEYDAWRYSSDMDRAMRYVHDMIGDFNNGVVGWVDWNLILDIENEDGAGGPNHAGNLCYAQMHIDSAGDLLVTKSYSSFYHFGHFITPGDVMIDHSLRTVSSLGVEASFFTSSDGKIIAVIANSDSEERIVALTAKDAASGYSVTLPGDSFATVVIS